MGTTLNGTKPKNTYQALLKTTDNTAIGGTLKTISDGLGTDTPLQLSTTETQINSTLRINTDNVELLDIQTIDASNRFNINRSVQKINLDFASKPSDITTVVGVIRTAINGVNLADVVKFQENGQVTLTERVKIESDSTVITQVSSVIQSSTTNANLVIAPNGTGALVANIPDGTAVGGNARGANAVDLQTYRTDASQVASGGYSSVAGGVGNTSSGQFSFSSGQTNVASGTSSVAMGQYNSASGNYSVSGGFGNAATGLMSVAFGNQNACTTKSFAAGGQFNTVSGSYSMILAGDNNIASSNNSIISGSNGIAYLITQRVLSVATINHADSQISELIAARVASLTTAATTILSLDGTGVTNLIIPLGSNRAWNVQINTIAIVSTITGTATGVTVGDSYSQVKNLLFKKVGGVSSIVGTVDTTSIKSDGSMNTAAVTITAGASQQMALTFTGPTFVGGGSVTMRVVARIQLAEVAF